MKNTQRKQTTKQSTYKQKRREEEKRKRRLLIIGGAVLGAILLAVILIIATQPPKQVGAYEIVPTQQWSQENGTSLGPADAKVVVTEYADFQCPICRSFKSVVFDPLYKDYIATGKIRYEYKHYLVIDSNTGGRESHQAALASECAAEQNRFWDYYNMLFINQQGEASGAFSNERLKAFAQAVGLDTAKFNSCFDSGKYNAEVNQDNVEAPKLGLTGTPSLLVNGTKITNAMNYDQVKAAIDAALKNVGQ